MAEKKTYISNADKVILKMALGSNDYGWDERTEPKKRVILTNPEAVKDTRLMSYVSAFKGTGHAEWEFLMAEFMIEAVGEALDTGKECDITVLFNTDFLAGARKNGGYSRRFTKDQVYKHIIKCFTIQEESAELLKLSINVAA